MRQYDIELALINGATLVGKYFPRIRGGIKKFAVDLGEDGMTEITGEQFLRAKKSFEFGSISNFSFTSWEGDGEAVRMGEARYKTK